ncbi:hypothetical protein DACRYDRAFT_18225 [Dacryopinax primogenitus]|uniref:Transcription regulator Rua1 C-terminal domain-containing protein n=1 Tax=Dacryopinax primogenitus (strain DJM 731) TaxID=1858805 RepID=M5FP16_DACPD|nr:uncharacterized protein DACRYDRAFT_18225 [Dacryopinax primogenitus]EJT98145.1 hypothetical protein DACRYDRAFT_18225 [Dacryopinax primogenitus]
MSTNRPLTNITNTPSRRRRQKRDSPPTLKLEDWLHISPASSSPPDLAAASSSQSRNSAKLQSRTPPHPHSFSSLSPPLLLHANPFIDAEHTTDEWRNIVSSFGLDSHARGPYAVSLSIPTSGFPDPTFTSDRVSESSSPKLFSYDDDFSSFTPTYLTQDSPDSPLFHQLEGLPDAVYEPPDFAFSWSDSPRTSSSTSTSPVPERTRRILHSPNPFLGNFEMRSVSPVIPEARPLVEVSKPISKVQTTVIAVAETEVQVTPLASNCGHSRSSSSSSHRSGISLTAEGYLSVIPSSLKRHERVNTPVSALRSTAEWEKEDLDYVPPSPAPSSALTSLSSNDDSPENQTTSVIKRPLPYAIEEPSSPPNKRFRLSICAPTPIIAAPPIIPATSTKSRRKRLSSSSTTTSTSSRPARTWTSSTLTSLTASQHSVQGDTSSGTIKTTSSSVGSDDPHPATISSESAEEPSSPVPAERDPAIFDETGAYIRRILPPDVPIVEDFSLFYRRWPMSSLFAREDEIGHRALRQIGMTVKQPQGGWTYNEPRSVYDLYTPRLVKGMGKDKMAMCPVCIEPISRGGEGKRVAYKTKVSAYTFRTTERSVNTKNMKDTMREGRCHRCKKWIPLDGVRSGDVKVREIFWWKHAAKCHGEEDPVEDTHPLFEDALFHAYRSLSGN